MLVSMIIGLCIFSLIASIAIVLRVPKQFRWELGSFILTLIISTTLAVLLTLSNHHMPKCEAAKKDNQHCILVAVPVDNFQEN